MNPPTTLYCDAVDHMNINKNEQKYATTERKIIKNRVKKIDEVSKIIQSQFVLLGRSVCCVESRENKNGDSFDFEVVNSRLLCNCQIESLWQK